MNGEHCRLELNATHVASMNPEKWGYKGGTVRCPNYGKCKGDCCFDDDKFRSFEIIEERNCMVPTQTEKLLGKLTKYFELKSAS